MWVYLLGFAVCSALFLLPPPPLMLTGLLGLLALSRIRGARPSG